MHYYDRFKSDFYPILFPIFGIDFPSKDENQDENY